MKLVTSNIVIFYRGQQSKTFQSAFRRSSISAPLSRTLRTRSSLSWKSSKSQNQMFLPEYTERKEKPAKIQGKASKHQANSLSSGRGNQSLEDGLEKQERFDLWAISPNMSRIRRVTENVWKQKPIDGSSFSWLEHLMTNKQINAESAKNRIEQERIKKNNM